MNNKNLYKKKNKNVKNKKRTSLNRKKEKIIKYIYIKLSYLKQEYQRNNHSD